MVARNFVETNNNILYPRVDETNGDSGIIGMEFPVLNYLVYLISAITNYTHWLGRLINLIVATIGIFYFYRILKRYFTEEHAFYSSLILIVSIWFSFSRKMMPDTFCISLFFIGLYYGLRYLDENKKLDLLLFFIFCGLGSLAKIPAAIYFSIFLFPFLKKEITIKRKLTLTLSTLVILGMVYWWYFIWNPYLSSTFGNWYNNGMSLKSGYEEIVNNLQATLEKFYFSAFSSFILFIVFIAGLVVSIIRKKRNILIPFLVILFIFTIYIFKSGFYFHHHNYYIIPFVPVMALVAGYFLTTINKKVAIILLGIGMTEAIANQQHDFFIKDYEKYKIKLEQIADMVSKPEDLIAINGNGNPQQLYLAHRKGWVINDEEVNEQYLNKIKSQGCKYVFVNKHQLTPTLKYKEVYSDEGYVVFSLNEK